MDYAKFQINDIHFTVEPENKVEDKSTISLHDLSIESKNLSLMGILILHSLFIKVKDNSELEF